MRFKSFTLLACLAFWGLLTKAQTVDHSISFNETTHDFGTVKLNDKTETVFKFKNISKDTLRLTGVKASCGCTTPKWTQEVIDPGGSGEITVSYNSSKAGAFNKSITVNYSDRPEPVILYIKGDVLADETNMVSTGQISGISSTPSGVNYSIPRGALAFEKMIENVKSLTSEDVQAVEFRYKNTSGSDVKFLQEKTELDPGVTVTFKDLVLKPGQESVVKVSLDGKKFKAENQLDGFFSKRVAIVTDEAT